MELVFFQPYEAPFVFYKSAKLRWGQLKSYVQKSSIETKYQLTKQRYFERLERRQLNK